MFFGFQTKIIIVELHIHLSNLSIALNVILREGNQIKYFKEANCQALANIAGGTVTYLRTTTTDEYLTGTTALLTCELGRTLVGNSVSTCKSNGAWTPAIGSCQSGTGNSACTEITVSNGKVIYVQASSSSLYQQGTTAFLVCDFGFLITGNYFATCSNGQWSPSPGFCKSLLNNNTGGPTTCSPFSSVANAQIYYVQRSLSTQYAVDTIAILVCNTGFYPSGSLISKCTSSGTWETLGTCVSLGSYPNSGSTNTSNNSGSVTGGDSCPELAAVANGRISYDLFKPRGIGTFATLLCNFGYLGSGTAILYCESGGRWSGTIGSCNSVFGSAAATTVATGNSRSQCPALTVTNGAVTYYPQGSRTEGTMAVLACNIGYLINNNAVSLCQNTGAWYPSIGSCQSLNSGAFQPPNSGDSQLQCFPLYALNGNIIYDALNPRKPGTAATLVCSIGFILQGKMSVTCNSNGLWSGMSKMSINFDTVIYVAATSHSCDLFRNFSFIYILQRIDMSRIGR
ncbi:unnamed protein product [Enterobius vermicularis]|uniref:Sushi domain-containing protein n=1 Tax=Enterobius vermicularis TaxID=51028 RepID=A0A0N4V860_ENTVE|nr:unnamed protein product [Enterobius vermicularis]